jgi:hypothetical protein
MIFCEMTQRVTTQEKHRTQRQADQQRKYESWEDVGVAVDYFVVVLLY